MVTAIVNGRAQLAGVPERDSPVWAPDAARLLSEAHGDRWRQTVLSDVAEPREEETCLLVMPASAESATPALILVGKQRLHPLDGGVFTERDAEIAGHLAALTVPLVTVRPATVAAAPPIQTAPPTANGEAPPGQRQVIIDVLRREMDRCDRYHTVFALAAFRPELPPDPGGDFIRGLAGHLAVKVRSSDYVACLDDGTVLMIAPEDIQSLPRMQQRLVALVREAGSDDLVRAIRQAAAGQTALDPSVARRLLREFSREHAVLPPTDPLTDREIEVIRELAMGYSNAKIAGRLYISEATVRTHVSNILSKLHLKNRTQAALYAFKERIATLDDIGDLPDY